MKKLFISIIIGSLSVSALNAKSTKLYDVKSAKVTYKITGSSSMMGVESQTTGTKSITFDNYGMQSVTKENSRKTTTRNGTTQTKKTDTTLYMKDGVAYSVNHKNKTIQRMESMAGMMGGDIVAKSKTILKQMGGRQVGSAKVLGYTCEVWEAMGSKIYFYKAVPLKTESNMMGVVRTEVATSAKFNTHLSANEFKLPNYPVTDNMGNVVSRNKLSKMDAQHTQDMQELQGLMQGFQNGDMIGTMKQQMLSQEGAIREARDCLAKAHTEQAAIRCMAKMPDSDNVDMDDSSQSWNEQTKQEALSEMDSYLKSIPCIKKAHTMADLDTCMN
jgi:hypothetical protein